MRELKAAQQLELDEIFGPRVRYDRRERTLYSHDVGVMPALISPMVGNTMPHAVAQPENEEELVQLVRWASQNKMPLVPRGRATSGYGGVLPVKGGVVIDSFHMQRLITLDAENETVTVQGGMVWKNLDRALAKHGLTLRLYPTSYPSSTVAGWLAQGGGGLGSYEYGWFKENVVSARAVEADGTVHDYSGEELEMVADVEGITGIISQVTLRVRRLEEEKVRAAQFETADDLVQALQAIIEARVPLWSISFINPKMAELKNAAPEKHLHDEPHVEHPPMPEKYIGIFVYPASRAEAVEASLEGAVKAADGTWLSEELATHEWEDRFNLMKVKRLGPSLIPTEFIFPAAGLKGVLDDLKKRIKQPLVLEGMLVGGERPAEVIMLGFIPHDERTVGFNVAYAASLVAIKVAKEHGGRSYTTGLYFAGEAPHVLGAERLAQLKEYKARTDPDDLMNPGKVFLNGVGVTRRMSWMMGTAQKFEPMIRPFANLFKIKLGERIEKWSVRGVPADVAWYAYACSQCGFCVSDCDQFYGRGWESQSPRGKWFFLKEFMEGREEYDKDAVTTALICTTCERCNVNCCLGLPIEPSWMKMRGRLIHDRDTEEMMVDEDKMTFPPFYVMAASARKENNIWGAYRKDRDAWVTDDIAGRLKEKADIAYFAGCTASYVENDISQATTKMLAAAGYDFTYMGKDEACCGIPLLVSGQWDVWEEILRHNVAEMKKREAKTVVTSCPACWLVWAKVYPEWCEKLGIEYDFESKHYSELLSESIQRGDLQFTHEIPMRVTWHDSCHMGRAGGIYEPPRDVIKAIPGVDFVEVEHNRQEGLCCGSVLTLIGEPPVAHRIGDHRLQEAIDVEAEAMLAACPCCQFQLRVSADRMGTDMPIYDLAWFAAKGLGMDDMVESTHYALTQWAVFEKMVYLMTPCGFADLMADMFPELLDAMPLGMGKMMSFFGKLGGGFMVDAMKPVFPILFPILLPGMMPKVMDKMLTLMHARIPSMPDYMLEQMPELMPTVMDGLMPKMLPELIPTVTPLMVDYLKGKDISQRETPFGKGQAPWELDCGQYWMHRKRKHLQMA
jgi:Fe-S oxidoreductase/FAD/FMN-containing dehydrogenase